MRDVEFVILDGIFTDSNGEPVRLRDQGKCCFIGMGGYPLHAMRRAISQTDLEVVLNDAHFTLLNTELTGGLLPTADARSAGNVVSTWPTTPLTGCSA